MKTLLFVVLLLSGCAFDAGPARDVGSLAPRVQAEHPACSAVTLSRNSGPMYSAVCEVR